MKLIENLDEIKNSKRHYFNVALNNLLPTLQSNISDVSSAYTCPTYINNNNNNE